MILPDAFVARVVASNNATATDADLAENTFTFTRSGIDADYGYYHYSGSQMEMGF
jgi:hypothetical protein